MSNLKKTLVRQVSLPYDLRCQYDINRLFLLVESGLSLNLTSPVRPLTKANLFYGRYYICQIAASRLFKIKLMSEMK